MRHTDPGVLAWLGREDVGNDDVRSDNCGSIFGESGHARCLSANLINDRGRGRLRGKQGTDLAEGHEERAAVGGGSALDTTLRGSVALCGAIWLAGAAARAEGLSWDRSHAATPLFVLSLIHI